MSEEHTRPNRRRIIVVVIVAVIIVAAAVFGITYLIGNASGSSGPDVPGPTETSAPADPDTGEDGDDVEFTPTPLQVLPEPMGGQEAIDALGDRIEIVAKRNGMTAEQLEELLLRDESARVSTNGFILYP